MKSCFNYLLCNPSMCFIFGLDPDILKEEDIHALEEGKLSILKSMATIHSMSSSLTHEGDRTPDSSPGNENRTPPDLPAPA